LDWLITLYPLPAAVQRCTVQSNRDLLDLIAQHQVFPRVLNYLCILGPDVHNSPRRLFNRQFGLFPPPSYLTDFEQPSSLSSFPLRSARKIIRNGVENFCERNRQYAIVNKGDFYLSPSELFPFFGCSCVRLAPFTSRRRTGPRTFFQRLLTEPIRPFTH